MNAFAKKTALVTGASAGLGVEFARQLAPHVSTLILTARRWDKLDALKKELEAKHAGLVVHHYAGDLSLADTPEALVRWTGEMGLKVDVLINNAGFGDYGPFESSDWTKVRNMISVNVMALTELTHRILPGMVERGSGTIINVASIAGLIAMPDFAVYAATKAYVCSFSDALCNELAGTGVTVTALCPGPVPTEFGDVAARPHSSRIFQPPAFFKVTPEKAVKDALCGATRGSARVIPGWVVKVPMLGMEVIPPFVLRNVSGLMKALIQGKNPKKAAENEPVAL